MTPKLSGRFSVFGLVFFVLKSLLGIAGQWSREKFAIYVLKARPGVMLEFSCIERGLLWLLILLSNRPFPSGLCRKTRLSAQPFIWK